MNESQCVIWEMCGFFKSGLKTWMAHQTTGWLGATGSLVYNPPIQYSLPGLSRLLFLRGAGEQGVLHALSSPSEPQYPPEYKEVLQQCAMHVTCNPLHRFYKDSPKGCKVLSPLSLTANPSQYIWFRFDDYNASGLISHNCRCWNILIVDSDWDWCSCGRGPGNPMVAVLL